MNEQGIRKFLMALGVPQDKMRLSRGWVNAPCVLAPWAHGDGVDEHPSFGVSISEGRSTFFCFGCSPKGQLLEGLLHNIFIMSGSYPWEAADVFVREENFDGEPDTSIPDVWAEIRQLPKPLPTQILKMFPLLQSKENQTAIACRQYLIGRGIPEWVQNMYQVRFDPKRGCLVFSLTDSRGYIFVMRERALQEKKIWTVNENVTKVQFEYAKISDAGVWFGMQWINWVKPVILVEGEIDTMRLAALGELNSIASSTSSVSDAQIDALHASVIYLGYDADKAGALAHHRISDRIKDRAVIFELDWSIVGRKDPAELKNKKEWEKVMEERREV